MSIFDKFWKKDVKGSVGEEKQGEKEVPVKPAGQPYKIGDRIAGQYEIYRILGGEGKSGMGIVYVCYAHEFKGVIALKTFQDRYLSSKGMKDNFKKEALLWTHLESHPYIVRAYLVQELDNRMFVACEFIAPDDEGRNTLSHYLKSPISPKQALIWPIMFCYGMEYAYSKGVTPHRDIKPDNIMITRNEILKIADFGLAGLWHNAETADELKRYLDEGGKGFTFIKMAGDRIACGTPPWMAPEQFDGIADVRSDIYSFGIVMYQMANGGRLPFYPREGDNWEIAHKTYPMSKLVSHLFPLVERCLTKKPEERYKGFDELKKDLERLYERETGKILPSLLSELSRPIGLEAEEYVTKGISLRNIGLIDAAIEEYKKAIRINPTLAIAHYNLGCALYTDKGLIDEAIKEYREAIKINPEDAKAYCNLGRALLNKNLIDESIGELKRAVMLDPQDAYSRSNLGVALSNKGLLDEAIEEFKEVINIDSKSAAAYSNLGRAFYEKGLFAEAIKELREALKINPKDVKAQQ